MKKKEYLSRILILAAFLTISLTASATQSFAQSLQKEESQTNAQNANGTESGYASILIGLLRTQYVKVSAVNQGDKAIPVRLVLIDDKGKVMILCNEIVASGKAVSETFQLSGNAPNRIEFYAQIRAQNNNDLKNLIPSVQIIDTETDRTDHFIGGSDFFAFRPIFNPPLIELPEIR